ncbi:MAG: hypothetical protein AB7T63_08435 [Planctomycetota bacterium]
MPIPNAFRMVLSLVGILAVGLLPGAAGRCALADPAPVVDDTKAREQRRVDFLERARAAVRPEDAAAGGMDDIEVVLSREADAWALVAPEQVERARELVGTEEAPGQVRQGAILYRWVTQGTGLPHLLLVDPESAGRDMAQLEPDRIDELANGDSTWEERADLLKRLLTAEIDVARRTDRQVVVRGTDASGQESGDAVPALRAFAGGYPFPREGEGAALGSLPRAPLLAEEMTSPWSRPWLRLRKVQLAERRRVWSAEKPSRGLENEERVRRKQERVDRLREEIKRLEQRRALVLAGLDQMVEVEQDLVTQGGVRAFEIEDIESRLEGAARPASPGGEPPEQPAPEQASAEDQRELERLRVAQWVGQQELRLLYITARRANERLAILDEGLAMAREEERIASEILGTFVEELNRIRRERQLGRLQAQVLQLERELKLAEQGSTSREGPAAAAWAARRQVAAELLEQNGLLRDLVTMRQEIESLVQGVRVDEASVKADVPKPASGEVGAAVAAAAAADPKAQALGVLANTTAPTLGPKRVALALEHLDALPADTVASLFAAADERIDQLGAAGQVSAEMQRLQARFEEQAAEVDSAMRGLQVKADAARYERSRHRSILATWRKGIVEPNVAAFQRAREGIEQQVKLAAERSAELERLRSALGTLGTRSLGIRVERTLTGQGLRNAWNDVQTAAGHVVSFVTFQGDQHLGTFVVDHLKGLLFTLLLVVACIFGVRIGHRAIDRWLDRKAQTVPALRRVGLSPTAESADAKAAAERVEAEKKAVAEAALKQASGEEAGKAPARPEDGAPAADEGAEGGAGAEGGEGEGTR